MKSVVVPSASLDGKDLSLVVMAEELIEVDAAPDNFLGVEGSVQGFACGAWAKIPPLTAGEHILSLTGGLVIDSGDVRADRYGAILRVEKRSDRRSVPAPSLSTTRVRAMGPQ